MIEKSVAIPTDQTIFRQRMDDLVSSPLIKSFMAGAVSGTCSTILFQPLDLIKTRLQKSANLGTKLGMFAEIANVVRQERVLGLWTGLMPSLLRCVPGIGLYFTSLHWLKSSFGSEFPHPLESVIMGASARTIVGITVLPFTVLKTRYESGEFHYKSLSDGIRSTYAKEGFRALYSGLAPTLLRDVPFSGIYLMFYTHMKNLTSENGTTSAPYVNFTNGVLSGLLASFVTQPADVIKTNMQLYPTKYGRLKNVIILIYTERGLAGFWRGMVPRLMRRTLMSAMSWTMYEEVMRSYNIRT
uniref:Mitochondrial glycine transporter n=1 Tax=Arion vulgaris TaxID=1028688 RepID=A0A0B7AMB2_9EUPU